MKQLEDRIKKDGKVLSGNILKVDSFFNHMVDVELLDEMASEVYSVYKDRNITKVLTIETSGIPLAVLVAKQFNVPLIYANKTDAFNLEGDTYNAFVHSFTKKTEYHVRVVKDYISKEDNVLIVDDFLAEGASTCGLLDIVEQSGANLEAVVIGIEKTFQKGGKYLRESGIDVLSLAKIKSLKNGQIEFE